MEREVKSNDDYLDRLYKLLPAEITGAYLGVRVLISPEVDTFDKYLLFFAVVILILAPIFYFFVSKVTKPIQLSFLTFSYVVWAANIDVAKIIAAKDKHFASSEFAQFVLDGIFIKGFLIIWILILVPMVLKKPEQPL